MDDVRPLPSPLCPNGHLGPKAGDTVGKPTLNNANCHLLIASTWAHSDSGARAPNTVLSAIGGASSQAFGTICDESESVSHRIKRVLSKNSNAVEFDACVTHAARSVQGVERC